MIFSNGEKETYTKTEIVEDESNIAELLNLYLKKEGYETRVAEDGGKALELYLSCHG